MVLKYFLKTILFFITAVYILSLPAVYFILCPSVLVPDALLPYEVILCIFVSSVFFVWFIKSCIETYNAAKNYKN